jgi:pimeloyl-ACP methyl ester carboxylesterase
MKILLPLLLVPTLLLAQATPTVKQAPPPGIAVPEADAAELKAGLDALGKTIDTLRGISNISSEKASLLPDVEALHKAVRYALDYGEFFNPKEIAAAKALLALAQERTKDWQFGPAPWTAATGPLVLGYRSRIDDSVQPYGLIVPEDWKPGDKTPRPLYLWFHGRGDTLSEVNFIAGRLKAKRDFATANAFELHLYGRWCNASKFAGEMDAFEAMADVQRRYAIDPNRIACLGFSMGGATTWHMTAHHPGLWAVASAGAGFAETAIYAKVDDPKKEPPAPWERKLFSLYDSTVVAANFGNLPFIAYSGEIDPQKQSADIMEEALAKEGLKLERLIGPGVAHKYEPETKKELSKRIDAAIAKGRDPLPPHIRFVTYTLRYNQCKWVRLDALEQHWERAEIDATLVDEGTIRVKTKNVAGFTIAFPPGPVPLDKTHGPRVVIDEQELPGAAVREGWTQSFTKSSGRWGVGSGAGAASSPRAIETRPLETRPLNAEARMQLERELQLEAASTRTGVRKVHGLQGPIDDAFMDSFIFVRPTGKPLNDKVGAWAKSELDRAIREWRTVFRGDARVKDDTALTDDDIANANLVLWGDPGSNALLARMLPKLPIQWTKEQLTMGAQKASAADHAPIFIFPNPLNAHRYIVVNSGFTFRMGARTSNSLQTPKLPDWALIDLNTPPSERWPGKVVDAGFFDEQWLWPK